MNKRFRVVTAFLLSFSLVLSACGGVQSGSGEDSGADKVQKLSMTIPGEPPTMDSAKATDVMSFDILNNVKEGLYRLDKDNKPEPAIASGVDISEDKKTYIFNLREAKWSDEEPVRAQDFEYAWKRALNPKTASEYANILFPVKNAEAYNSGDVSADKVGVEAVDEKTLKVELEEPTSYFLSLTSFVTYMPQRKDIVEKHGKKYAQEVDKMVYNGPFDLSKWQHEQELNLKKSETYWDRNAVKLTDVTMNIVKDSSTGVNLYTSDQTDITELDSALADAFKKSAEYTPVTQSRNYFLQFNTKNEFLSNEKVRKAISYAIDRETLIKEVLKNGSKPAYALVPPTIYSSDNKIFRKEGTKGHQYNPSEAKRLLKEGMDELEFTEKPTLTLLSYDDHRKQAAVYIQEQLKINLGMDVKIDPQPMKQKIDREDNGDFVVTLAGWKADYNDPMSFLEIFSSDHPINVGFWENKKYDQLIEKSRGNSDYDKRSADMVGAEKIVLEEAALAPIYYAGKAYLQKQYVKDVVRHPIGAELSLKWAYLKGKGEK
ncbi:peptide ABC transporter substrate-binding protein [Paludifilum halophilum]|uniref:Peptide ABC transporter substrate-binding protein n=1 Tax=Paludifilum halophilum TaxID=1642702 RepID=A0A235B4I7_9BACL|nr:peptide ABC transporter substrate-binding protein [Paludifilum halophilum]OYD07204.1 peptide ABC transporter substrate-binding protein [Paludifilum halophilum]